MNFYYVLEQITSPETSRQTQQTKATGRGNCLLIESCRIFFVDYITCEDVQ